MQEIWKPVNGYEGFYIVSNLGNIKSLDRTIHRPSGTYLKKGKYRKPVFNKSNGYFEIVLNNSNGIKKTVYVHRVVATAFCENPNNELCVNHKNENKTDNRAENLEWCSQYYNNTYNGKAQRSEKKVVRINPNNMQSVVFRSAREAAEMTPNTNYKNISAVCRGKRKKCGGYYWHFLKEV